MSSVTSKLLTSKDGTVVYADAIGDPAKQSLVFVHGVGLSAAVFNNIFSDVRYSSEFYMIRYDMRGHGRSGKPDTEEAYASIKYAEDYLAVAQGFSLNKPVFVGWSMGGMSLNYFYRPVHSCFPSATVVADIAQHLPRDTLSGVVYLMGLPYIGPIMGVVGTPTVRSFVPGLCSNDDVTAYIKNKAAFVDSLFTDPDSVPYDLKCHWIGVSMAQGPATAKLIFGRKQDPTALFAWAKEGLPLLVLGGTADKQMIVHKIAEEMNVHFTNQTVRIFDGLGHALFYEDLAGVMAAIVEFTRKVGKILLPIAGDGNLQQTFNLEITNEQRT
ncbi:alpha/beta-hydrolase [Amylostereum chailletii]|nr:alpha/beta-hydrolase [Amylostereum chailletii]